MKNKTKVMLLALIMVSGFTILYLYKNMNRKNETVKNEGKQKEVVENLPKKTEQDNVKVHDCDFVQRPDEKLSDVLSNGKPSMIVFSMDNCPACVSYLPTIEKTGQEYKDKVNVRILNLNTHFKEFNEYSIAGTPTTIFYDKDGKKYEPSEEIKKKLGSNMYKNSGNTLFLGPLNSEIITEVFKEL